MENLEEKYQLVLKDCIETFLMNGKFTISSETKNNFMGKNIKFTALFVKDIEELLNRFPPKHKKIFGHHSTIEFQPEILEGLEIGKEYKIKIIGRAFDEFGDDLLIENPKSKNKYPHITLSRSEDAPSLYSKILFEKAINSNAIQYFNNESVKVIEGYCDFNNNIFI